MRQVIAEHPAECIKLGKPEISIIGDDVLLEYEVCSGAGVEKCNAEKRGDVACGKNTSEYEVKN